MGNIKYLMVLAIAATGLFAMPGMLAAYAGTHTIEANNPTVSGGSVTDSTRLDCTTCHTYILNSAQSTNESKSIFIVHGAAANDINYTTYLAYYGTDMNATSKMVVPAGYNLYFTARANNTAGTVKVGDYLGRNSTTNLWFVVNSSLGDLGNNATDSYGGQTWSACLFCHRANNLGGTHTKVQVRGCTNAWCHGPGINATNVNGVAGRADGRSYMADIPNYVNSAAQYPGKYIQQTSDAHNGAFATFGGINDPNYNTAAPGVAGNPLSEDYYLCMGCHTHGDLNINITKPTGYNLTVNDLTGTVSVTTYQNASGYLLGYKQGSAFK